MSTKTEARQTFHDKMEECYLVFKMKDLGDDQRVTVAAYSPDQNILNIGVATRYFKDDYDKKKAKEVACSRAIFSPTETLVVPNMDRLKILDIIKDYKKTYEIFRNDPEMHLGGLSVQSA